MDATVNVEIGPGFEEAIEEYIRGLEQFKPVEVVNNCDHAIYVEYGSHGARPGATSNGAAKANIREWARVKLQHPEAWYGVYQKIMSVGTLPKPFFRPACNLVGDDPQSYAERDGEVSLLNLAKEIVHQSRMNLMMSGSNYRYEVFTGFEIRDGN